MVAENLKEQLYATLTVMAVTLGLTRAEHLTPAMAALAVTATALGLWLATVIADQQAHRVVYGEVARGADLRRLLYVSGPLLGCALAPLLLIGLSALGVLPLVDALYTSTWLGAAALFTWGCRAGLRMGASRVAAVVAGLLDLGVGAVVVVIKLASGH
ncbi:hypothetical protein SAMN05414137_107164 [Streptacidiphilus jiangxiensis]|uniref:Uncharacterized protein n=1 Tax=Streptacidiphilus jiangxiensis TaxID=235985 RepID=A0A1H7P1X1_STRJI|nr:hypothetical protein SAMN05414137_107164 [Streptacidiphilus jiangxiensis]